MTDGCLQLDTWGLGESRQPEHRKVRDVLVSYSANPGRIATSRRHSSARSSPVTPLASTGKVAVPTSTVIRGWAFRLWYQSGFVGDPPLVPAMIMSSPSGR